jgi:hypothetical protein
MSENSPTPRKALHLVLEGFPVEQLDEVMKSARAIGTAEIFHLTEANAKEALEKIFAADTVAVWTRLDQPAAHRSKDNA